jgi:hypothetical protein
VIALGPYLAAALLLVVAGALKAHDPGDFATALARATRWSPGAARAVVRIGAVAELSVGVAAIVHPGPVRAALVAVSYLAFTVYVIWLRATGGPLATCGCFGAVDTPPTLAHVAVDATLAAAALVATEVDGTWLPALLAEEPGSGVPLLLAAVTVAVLAYGVLSPLAQVHGARRLYGAAR